MVDVPRRNNELWLIYCFVGIVVMLAITALLGLR